MPIAGSIESKIANWPAVRPPIIAPELGHQLHARLHEINRRGAAVRHGAADAAGEEALQVVVRRVQRVVVNRAFDGHFEFWSQRAFVLSGVSGAYGS